MRGFLRRCALPAKYIAFCGVLALAVLAALVVELPPLYQNVRPATPQAYFSHPGGYLDINTANAAELELIEGVGPVKAQRIVEYREAHGPFASVEELALFLDMDIEDIRSVLRLTGEE